MNEDYYLGYHNVETKDVNFIRMYDGVPKSIIDEFEERVPEMDIYYNNGNITFVPGFDSKLIVKTVEDNHAEKYLNKRRLRR